MTDYKEELEAIAEALTLLAHSIPDAESLRTDHPLQGQTFTDISDNLREISDSIKYAADKIYDGLEILATAMEKDAE